ncbi:beta strand repeat-containing protein [Sutterella wadsworthensis]|uniref:beta strand repeat-containing protein n=1 Tax=Sutterella wadsworthensis TaxID=40545 RepID=UPI003A9170A3
MTEAGNDDLKIGNTHVTLSGQGSVTYFIGGSKANNADSTNLTTGNVTAVISGGTVTGSAMSWGNKDKISVVGGSYVKSTGAGGGTPASTTAKTGDISLSISDGTFTGAVFGGSVADNYGKEQASDSSKPDLSITTGVSSLRIEGGTFQSSNPEKPKDYDFGVFGGSAALGQKSSTESSGSSVIIDAKNDVDITGRVVGGDLLGFGGKDNYATSSKITGSTSVSITGSEKIETSESVIGGSLLHLTLDGESSSSSISGTSSVFVDAENATLGDEVIGGSYVRQRDSKVTNTASVTVESTSVTIQNGTVKGNVIGGGHSKIGQGASGTMAADVEGQASIQMTGGTVHGVIGGGLSYAYDTTGKFVSTSAVGSSAVSISGDSTVEAITYLAAGDEVNISAAVVGGGVSWNKKNSETTTLTSTSDASSVVIDGATINDNVVGGGYAYGSGSETAVKSASLTISNAELGSSGKEVNVYAGGVASANAKSSSVESALLQITATKVSGSVYTGGSGANSTVGTSSASLTDTTVSGELNFKGSDETSIVFNGVNSVGNVTGTAQSYTFNAADDQNDPVLTIGDGKGTIDLSAAKSIRAKAKAGQTLIDGSVKTDKEIVVVVETPTGDFTYNVGAGTGDGMGISSGGLQIGESTISGKGEANTNSKTLSEAFLGSVAFVNQGAEFIADEGLNAAVRAAQGAPGFTAFGAIHGGKSRYETGSHVDLRGTSLAAGAAGRVGGALIAGFVEAGWASSDSHVNGARGDADHDYYGVGAALRYDFSTPFYLEGSVRAGSASTDFDGAFGNASAHFESDAFYASAHLGGGYVFKLDPVQLDLYGRYTVTYLDNDDTDLGTGYGETLSMSSATTHALRIGGRLTGDFSETTSWKVGAAYEHVFDGDAEADILFGGSAAALDVPSLSGNTGILELGLSVKPSAASPWTADIGVKGYVGDRRGAAGSISVLYAF